ncbi:anaerobic dimethyl sulfoxide reductase subunit C (anchor subunit) [Rahnella sp. BIGb0236]|uniref:dimethyl sulfoxide reductase anchor subunit family protein n=1 Tax=Rahnella TaxID=34037 RepID=UPI000BB1CD1E|nr:MULTISPECIES: dimethyl sulfoxide reductase anchor subunit family protein [Rahnella]PBI79775.1 dimethylsulfoxide reductase [Rahnella victoriana]TDS87898.1 anaerobic dimethyl sulfoxide reductase subunit C (anchor subunit) [Rahnella sp. BIGb0236]VTQ60869.1 Anaerobic dimethyl sulfoxide reductase chain C [Campylobacter jejuni]
MGNGWHEWPLMVFTVLGQCVVGAFIVLAIALLSRRTVDEYRRIHLSMFFLWVLMAIAFIASVLHLGSPLRAFNSLNRLGASPLSNEIGSGSLFFALGGIYWLLATLNKMPRALAKIWLIVTMLAGIGFVFAMCRVYEINTVPTWDNAYTALHFALTVLIGGPVLGYLLLRGAGINGCALRLLPVVSLVALIVSMAVVVLQSASLAGINSSVQAASTLIPQYGVLSVWRLVLIVLGLGCWFCPLIMRKRPALASMILAFVLVFGGELIGRAIFYGLHMTVGMAVSG